MSVTTPHIEVPTTTAASTSTHTPAVWRVGAVAAMAAAVATTIFAVAAKALDVSFEIDGQAIPTLGFGQITLLWSAVGVGLAAILARRAKRPAHTFVVTTVALTVLSFVPSLGTPDIDGGSRVALVLSHVVAAAIVIPALAARLRQVQQERS